VTRHDVGRGSAYYVATRLDEDALGALLAPVLDEAGVAREPVPAGVEAVRREQHLFLLNHGDEAAEVAASGTDLLTGAVHDGTLVLPPGGVSVLRSPLAARRQDAAGA
jgi:beta-galactosidase